MTDDNWEIVLDVHLRGTYLRHQGGLRPDARTGHGGRIIMTSSTSGLLGNFGQTNYGAAKAGIAGFMRCLAPEGAKYGITVNLLAPAAFSRLTEDIMPGSGRRAAMAPEKVSPAVVWLCTDQAAGVTGRHVRRRRQQGAAARLAARADRGTAQTDQDPWSVEEIGEKILASKDTWPPINPMRMG